MRSPRRARNLQGIVVALQQTIGTWTDAKLLRNIFLRKTAEPGMEVDLPPKDLVANDTTAWIERGSPADGLSDLRKKFVLAGGKVFGNIAGGDVPSQSQAQQIPAITADRKVPKQFSRCVERGQNVGIAYLASGLPFCGPFDELVQVGVLQAPDLPAPFPTIVILINPFVGPGVRQGNRQAGGQRDDLTWRQIGLADFTELDRA